VWLAPVWKRFLNGNDRISDPTVASQLLGGCLVGEALQKFALDDPLVQAARHELARYNRTLKQIAAFDAIFNRGYFRWPVNLPVEELDDLFRPSILHDEEVSWGPRSSKITAAFEHISTCFASIVEAARTNKIKVVDMDNKPVPAAVWRRRGIVIDLNTSDLYDGLNGGVLLRRNLSFVPKPMENAADQERRGEPFPQYPKSDLYQDIERVVQAVRGGPMDKRTKACLWIQRRASATTKFEQAAEYLGEEWLRNQGYDPGDEIDTGQLRGFVLGRFHPTDEDEEPESAQARAISRRVVPNYVRASLSPADKLIQQAVDNLWDGAMPEIPPKDFRARAGKFIKEKLKATVPSRPTFNRYAAKVKRQAKGS
jgi:hypothetical protein